MYNILVCDDEKEIVDAVEIYLMQEGYRVFKAYDGNQALEIMKKENIHLLIIDLMMPGMDRPTPKTDCRGSSAHSSLMNAASARK